MTQYSSALLRSRIVSRSARSHDDYFANGEATRSATKAYQKQTASSAAESVVKKARRQRMSTEKSRERRARKRRISGPQNMPPDVREHYTAGEGAALAVIADECKKRGNRCELCLDEIANIAGVSRTTVQNAIRKASSKELQHLAVKERRRPFGKSLTNIIKVLSFGWMKWLAMKIGFKKLRTPRTEVKTSLFEHDETEKTAFEKEFEDHPCHPSNRNESAEERKDRSGGRKWWQYGSTASAAYG
ncbi:hypothetical protein [Rhizobium sp. P007]|uniref:hypothetical protein n=1 Tax=Rhizobium sp. P007 TaxID=285908 RepID=UPI001157990B|nr:hypothetical protein [Rhizobium sp. P007]CAD7059032.1 hypothetical protein RP007_03019 [Rhizobium sp. P007]